MARYLPSDDDDSPERSVPAAVEEGARRTGRTPHRRDWRMVREVFVAETDAEAQRLSLGGMMAQAFALRKARIRDVLQRRMPDAPGRRGGS